MKKYLILCSLMTLILLTGCKKEKSQEFNPDDNLDLDHVFFDDFTSGIDMEKWEIAHQQWGAGNNGVIYQNVNYTEDGIVVLQSNGDLYAGDLNGVNSSDGRRTGAALVSNQAFGPGRFEVKMKILPRFGATTAFWTYYYHHETDANHEIDIELNVGNDFKQAWFTNWLTVDDRDHRINNTDIVNNDGQWHTYKFEWHTDPKRIDYYIDDVLFHTSTSFIPDFAARLWIGNWFPDSWAGVPDFETDYTLVDWFKYTPYLNNPYVETPNNENNFANRYPVAPIELPVNNLVSNPGFEGREEAWRKATDSLSSITAEEGIDGSNAMYIPTGDISYQFITGLDDSFEITVKLNGKFDENLSDGGQLLIEFLPLDTKILGTQIIEFNTTDENFVNNTFYEKTMTFKLPEGTKRLRLNLMGKTTGGIYFDNLFVNLKSKTPTK